MPPPPKNSWSSQEMLWELSCCHCDSVFWRLQWWNLSHIYPPCREDNVQCPLQELQHLWLSEFEPQPTVSLECQTGRAYGRSEPSYSSSAAVCKILFCEAVASSGITLYYTTQIVCRWLLFPVFGLLGLLIHGAIIMLQVLLGSVNIFFCYR